MFSQLWLISQVSLPSTGNPGATLRGSRAGSFLCGVHFGLSQSTEAFSGLEGGPDGAGMTVDDGQQVTSEREISPKHVPFCAILFHLMGGAVSV